MAIDSISDTDMRTGISKDIHADINIGVHIDTHIHTHTQIAKKKKEKTCAIQCRSNNRLHTEFLINDEEEMSNSLGKKYTFH